MKSLATESPTHLLAERAQAGDRAAFDVLFLRFQDRLRRQFTVRMGSRVRAKLAPEDIVQHAFAVAFDSLETFTWRGEESFCPWLGSSAERGIWSSSQKKVWDEISLSRDPSARDVARSRHARRDERFDGLEKALESLSDDRRRGVTIARLERLEAKRIAVRLNRSPDAVKKLVVRALINLKKSFGNTESLHLPNRRLTAFEERNDE